MIAYKLLKQRKDGSIGPLFIDAARRLPVGEWMEAEDHPTKGFAHRPGWHCTVTPSAPHLKERTATQRRVWYRVEVQEVKTFRRPSSQGGTWLLAGRMRILEPLEKRDAAYTA